MRYGIAGIKGGGGVSNTMLTTTTDATENSGTYTLDLTYLSDTPKVNDYVVYVDSGAITTLYQVSAVGSTNATLEKIGDIGGGGGKQLYQHYISLYKMSDKFSIMFNIISDRATAYDTTALWNYVKANGWIKANGFLWTSGNQFIISAVKWDTANDRPRVYGLQNNTSITIYYYSGWSGASIEEYTPIAL